MNNTLTYQKAVKGGVVYSHHWATGYQLLLFPDHDTARAYAVEHDWDYKK